jgi:hypothetical protein
MYAREFDLIDKMVAVLMSKIYKSVEGGAKDLRPMLESELCLQLTAEATANSGVPQTFWGKSVDVEKMVKFLGMSCAEYLDLKTILANKEIQNAYYYDRIETQVDGAKVNTVLNLFTLAVARLDSINVEEQAAREAREKKAREFLVSDEEIRKVLSVIYEVMFSRINDGTLRTSNGVGKKVAVIPPNLGAVNEHECLENIEIATPAAEILHLLRSLYYNSNVLGNRSEDRQEFIARLLEIVPISKEADREGVDSDSQRATFHRALYRHVFKETQAILNAIRILYPIEVADKEKEPKIQSVEDKLDTKGKESEAISSIGGNSSTSSSSSGNDSPSRSSSEKGRFFKFSPDWSRVSLYGSDGLTSVPRKMKKNG